MQRQKLEYEENEDRSDTEEEKPVVVVLKTGDLTAEDVDEIDMLKKKQEGWCLLVEMSAIRSVLSLMHKCNVIYMSLCHPASSIILTIFGERKKEVS